MTTQEIFGMDRPPKIDTRTPEDLGYPKSPTRAERDTWRPDYVAGQTAA
jgi:hypothetical protein